MKSLSEGLSPQRSIRIPDRTWDKFRAVCDYEGESMSEALREAVEKRLAEYPQLQWEEDPTGHGTERLVIVCDICGDAAEAQYESEWADYTCGWCLNKMHGDD